MEKFKSYVTNIEWERIHMYLTIEIEKGVELSNDVKFFLVTEEYLVEAFFDVKEKRGSQYVLALNVTNNGTNRCVNNGTYTLLVVDGESKISEAGYIGTSPMLEVWGRCFRYLSNVGAYTVTFLLDEYAEESRFQLLFYNTVKRSMGNIVQLPPIEQVLTEHNIVKPEKVDTPAAGTVLKVKFPFSRTIQKIAKRKLEKYVRKYLDCINKKAHKDGTRKKTILFMSEQDDKLALNMQALVDRMVERGLDKQFKIDFSLRKATSEVQSLKSTMNMRKKVAKADLIVVDDHVPLFNSFVLPENTKLIQIWHAGAGFKGVGYSRWGHAGCPGPFSAHRQYEYCISGSTNIAHFFSEQFGILDEQIIPTGMPRMDSYLNKENREKVTKELYERYPQAKGQKVILFAPTYRGRDRANAYYPYERVDFDALYEFCQKNDYVVFFKMHPWVAHPVPIEEKHSDKFFDLNTYPNINELFYITDLLITDYSSSIYEFSLMEKPMMFFVYDKVQYSTSRGFHRDYDSNVPGKVCESFAEVMDALRTEDFEFEKVAKYREDHFDFVDDHASDRVIDWLILGNLPEKYKKAIEEKRNYVQSVRGKYFGMYFEEE